MQEETFFCSDFIRDHFEIVFIPLVVHIPQPENSHLRYFQFDYVAVSMVSYVFFQCVLTFCFFV